VATRYPLPDATRLKTLFGVLFDGLEVKPGAKLDPAATAYAAVFVADDGSPVALAACDIQFAANSSAALSMLPPGAAKDAAKSKELTDMMLANLGEIMNIGTRLLITDTSPHLKLDRVYAANALPPPAAAVAAGAQGCVDFDVAIAKYGNGLLSIMCL
jgi:hypothetical protein